MRSSTAAKGQAFGIDRIVQCQIRLQAGAAGKQHKGEDAEE